MTNITSYLTFSGNCREAMTFYNKCLDGELTLQSIGDSPMADKMPEQMKECILHATIIKNNLVLMGSDMVPDDGLIKGNSVSLVLNCSSDKEIRSLYKKLSAGGNATHPLENTFWGATFGGLTDKFGNHWLLNFDNTNTKKTNCMKQLDFSIHINAPREAVWQSLWDEQSYNKWTSVFGEGSHAVTDWKEGSKVLFLGDKDSGMVSEIVSKKPNEYMSFRHLGEVKEGVEHLNSEWAGGMENYTLVEEDGGTRLNVEMQGNISDGFLDYFKGIWPKALDLLKEIAENHSK